METSVGVVPYVRRIQRIRRILGRRRFDGGEMAARRLIDGKKTLV